MRIISGIYRGRRLNPPASFKARPTTDYARESLFNILSSRYDFDEMAILDLFAGTGSIGLEFCSRGASKVMMVDINKVHTGFIKQSVKTLGAAGVMVMHANVKDYLRRSKYTFDIIFADPPYDLPWLKDLPSMVLESGLLKDNALFILEHPKSYNFNSHTGFSEQRHYGSVNFSFFSI